MPRKSTQPKNENEILRFLQRRYPHVDSSIRKGIGDDAAVFLPGKQGEYWLVTTDMLVENIDFRCDWTTPRQLGRKSVSVNLSDIAAMGACPRFITVSLGLPTGISRYWIRQFYRGLVERSRKFGADLVGGDLSNSESGIVISMTVLGESVRRKVLYRSGSREGDILYVTGVLGKSAAGLRLLEGGCIHTRAHRRREAIRSHREPEPRCEAGMWLAQSGMARCMMDITDGLSADLPRLCAASGVSAEIDVERLPLFREAAEWGYDPLDLALHGGEDFELLFAVGKSKATVFEKSYPDSLPRITRIGRMVRGKGEVWIRRSGGNRRHLQNRGFDHFSRNAG